MRRTFFAVTVAALANFAAVVHADEGPISASGIAPPQPKLSFGHLLLAHGTPMSSAPNRRVMLASIVGSGKIGEACHVEVSNGDYMNTGIYRDDVDEGRHKDETWCCGPGSSRQHCYNCDSSNSTCIDGNKM